jgi:CheY-like chemotaxis protein
METKNIDRVYSLIEEVVELFTVMPGSNSDRVAVGILIDMIKSIYDLAKESDLQELKDEIEKIEYCLNGECDIDNYEKLLSCLLKCRDCLGRLLADKVAEVKETSLLIVDYDKIMLSMLTARYRNKGYKVYSVDDPKEALKLFKNNSFDIIISEFYMPTMQGDEFISEIRKINRDVKIIILSGQKNEDFIQRSLSLGADDYVTKPFSPVELDLRIRRFVR